MKHELFNKVYVSETGNWVGRCMKCGIDLVIWTGAESRLPKMYLSSALRYRYGAVETFHYGPCPGQKIAPGLFDRKKMYKDPLDRIPIGIHYYGLTTVMKREPEEDLVIIIVEHRGNMGNTTMNVDDNLYKLCGVRFRELDSHHGYLSMRSTGSPDYFYQRTWRFSRKKGDKLKGVSVRSSYFTTPIGLGDTPRSVRLAWGRPWHMQKEGCCLYYYWGSLSRPHSIVKFIDGSAESIWSDATAGLITRGKGD